MWKLEQFSENTAILDEYGTALTYAELEIECANLAKHIEKRCLVFQLCENRIGSLMGYISFLNHGIVPVMLSLHLEGKSLEVLMEKYRPAYVWCPEGTRLGSQGVTALYSAFGYCLFRTDYGNGYVLHDDLALLLTTSGSTGSPKFVRQSYDNIKENTKSIVEYLRLDASERAVTTLPMNYTYGLSIINSHLWVGATLLVTDKAMTQREFWAFFKNAEATSFGGVPYTYEMLDRMRFVRMELPCLKTMTQAGGKLAPELHEKFAAYAEREGKNFVVMYGQCEATARMGYLPADKAVEKKGSMGIAIPGGKFTLVDPDGREITVPHTTGELVYEGANVTMGYAEFGGDLIKGDEWKGILHTGDMAQFDEEGYYYIVGRKKRFLKIYGNRINLDEVERLIKGEFEIDCACGGIDDRMYIFVTDETVSRRTKEFVAHRTGLNPAAFKTVILGEIPKNESGKTLYKELEKFYG